MQDKITQITELAVNAKSQKVRDVYEKQIEGHAEQIAELEYNSVEDVDFDVPYRTALEKAMTLLEIPYKILHSVDVREQGNFSSLFLKKDWHIAKKQVIETINCLLLQGYLRILLPQTPKMWRCAHPKPTYRKMAGK